LQNTTPFFGAGFLIGVFGLGFLKSLPDILQVAAIILAVILLAITAFQFGRLIIQEIRQEKSPLTKVFKTFRIRLHK